jgi:four helix bundle protein
MDDLGCHQKYRNELQSRLFKFAVKVVQLVRFLPVGKDYEVISYQIIKSATSCGANYEEAQGAVSKADFSNKVGITLKEMRESNYWIRLIAEVTEKNQEWLTLKKESFELMNILGSIYSKVSTQSLKDKG